jgi:hypothetical protein
VILLARNDVLNVLKGLIIMCKLLFTDTHENILDKECDNLLSLFIYLIIILSIPLVCGYHIILPIYIVCVILCLSILLILLIRLVLFRKIQNKFKKIKVVYLFVKLSLTCSILIITCTIIGMFYLLHANV